MEKVKVSRPLGLVREKEEEDPADPLPTLTVREGAFTLAMRGKKENKASRNNTIFFILSLLIDFNS
jgi:hypothetical protein